jgi:hypothetical protein
LCSIQVELVDMGIIKNLPSCKIKQLPSEYLRVMFCYCFMAYLF